MSVSDQQRKLFYRPITEKTEQFDRWQRRIEREFAFVASFKEVLPEETTRGWDEIIGQAREIVSGWNPATGSATYADRVRAAEAKMAPIGEVAKQYRIHCVGHGHIDMNWMWSWPETVSTTHDTFASVLSFMDQYPGFTYSQSQAAVYALVERYYPEMFERIRQRVAEGVWEVTAAHWVEGDKNLSSAESLCRHLLYSRDYFARKFDLSPGDIPVDWEPDTFGHAATIPSILAQGGVRYYYSCRMGGGHGHLRLGADRPHLFYWEAPDGARVLVNRESTWYNSFEVTMDITPALIAFVRETGLHDWLNIYGVGNHGGGPTRMEIDYYRETMEWPIYPRIVFGTALGFFKSIEEQRGSGIGHEIPVLSQELNFEFTGCYTSQSSIKRANRFGENYMLEAETLAAIASRVYNSTYPTEMLREAWIHVLFNQFHDILPGSGVRETREHAQALFQEVGAITGSIKRTTLKAIADRIDTLALLPEGVDSVRERELNQTGKANTPFVAGAGLQAGLSGFSSASGGGRSFLPFVVYNPTPWERSETVMVRLYDTDWGSSPVVARDELGVAHPTVDMWTESAWGHTFRTVIFDAIAVPAYGYRTYLFCKGTPSGSESVVKQMGETEIDTPFLSCRWDRYRSGVSSLVDKRTGVEFVRAGAGSLGSWEYVVEHSRWMSAWILSELQGPPKPLTSAWLDIKGGHYNADRHENMGASSGVQVRTGLSVPDTKSSVKLAADIHGIEPRIDFTAEIDWREIGEFATGVPGLILRFPLGLTNLTTRYEIPFGSIERDLYHGEEVPSLRYAYIEGDGRLADGTTKRVGFTLLQDCKYGHFVEGSDLCLRIVRSSFDPDHAPEVAKSTVRYSIFLHDTPATPAELTRLGAAWNHPLIAIPTNLQAGDAPAKRGFLQVPTENVVLTCFKQAEDGKGLILRLSELNGVDTEAVVEFDPAVTAGLSQAYYQDLMEATTSTDGLSFDGRTLKVEVKAHSFVTVRLS